jgi:endoglucanase
MRRSHIGRTVALMKKQLPLAAAIIVISALLVAPLAALQSRPAKDVLRAANAPWMPGINLAIGEFGSHGTVLGKDYRYPEPGEMDYYLDKGLILFRIPFLASRVLDLESGAKPQLTSDIVYLVALIEHAGERGAYVILDMHDYGRIPPAGLIGRDEGASELFAAAWAVIAERMKVYPNVIIGLMNEPYVQTPEEWLAGANAAIASIRNTGARQMILVPGTRWSGAHSWIRSGNARVMTGVEDPIDNYAIEVHQYFDWDSSGTSPYVIPGVGRSRLAAFTEWARKNGLRAVLGEFGWADNSLAHTEGENALAFMSENRDVWIGFTYWAGGPWWGDYIFSIEPKNGEDRPQMKILQQYML